MSRSQMAATNLIKNLQALVSVRVALETSPTDGKFDSNNNDSIKKQLR